MINNSGLETICKALDGFPPDWDEIVSKYKSLNSNRRLKKSFNLGYYVGDFSEIHLGVSMEKIKKLHPEINVELDPIGRKGEGGFHLDLLKRVRYCHDKKNASYEYDKVCLIDGLPVVFEIKTTGWGGSLNSKKRIPIRKLVMPERYIPKLDPLKEFFGKDVGYVIVTPKNIYRPQEERRHKFPPGTFNFSWRKHFLDNNGMWVFLYTTREGFKEDCERAVEGSGLNLKN